MVAKNGDQLELGRGENVDELELKQMPWPARGWDDIGTVHLQYRFVSRTGTKESSRYSHLSSRLPPPFSTGSYHEPVLKVPYEPGLDLAGALGIRTGTNAPIGTGS